MLWTNLTHNLRYFFVGRYAGLVGYYFPAVFALVAFLAAPRRRPAWQYLVLAAGLAQIGFFILTQPYSWLGGGGSVGNRYFMGAYGVFLFLLPPLSRTWIAIIPWLIGGLFTAQLVLNPFVASFRPGEYARQGPLRRLPVELTMITDLPINTDRTRMQWFGDNPPDHKDPGFQVYFLDDNAYQREEDKSFWVKGESRAEFLVKAQYLEGIDRPMRRLVLSLTAGALATGVDASVGGRRQRITLPAGSSQQVAFNLPRGFWYQARAHVWVVSVSSSTGFAPIFHDASSTDTRFLGVRVKHTLVE